MTNPISVPDSPSFVSANIKFQSINGVTRSPFTGHQQVASHPGEFWKGELVLPPMTESEFQPWKAFLLKARGQNRTFKVGDPLRDSPRGNASGTPVIAGPGNTPLVTLDGYSDYINIPHNTDYNFSSSFSLEIAISPNNLDTQQVIASKVIDSNKDEDWEIGLTSGNKPYFIIGDGSKQKLDSSFTVEKGTTYYIAATYDGSTMEIYVDGDSQGTKSISTTISNGGGDVRVGSRPDGAQFFDGDVSDFRIWSDTRTQTEIQNNMLTTLDGSESGLVGYWKINDGSDSTPDDQTSNSNDAELKGNASWVSAQGDTIVIRGWDASTNNVLKESDNIEVSDRLKSIIGDQDSNSAGMTKTEVRPKFRQPIDEGTSVITDEPKGEFRLSTNTSGWEERAPRIYDGISLQIVEHF